MKVVFHFAAGPALAREVAQLAPGEIEIAICPEQDDRRFLLLLGEAEVLWHVLKPVTAAMLDAAPKLRLVQKIGVGVNTIDLEHARRRGIAVCNLPGTNAAAVAELTLLLMLAALRRLPSLHTALRNGAWAVAPDMQDSLAELGGRTVGLVGLGSVARRLATVLDALGCRVIYTSRSVKPDAPAGYRTLDALLAEADVVSLHVPLTQETAGMIGAERIARMRSGSVLVNTARGGLVDQAALTAALAAGRLAAAGLDVFVHEPIDPADPILRLDNVVLTPHVGWLTTGTFERSLALAAENCRRLGRGEALLHRVV